MRSHRLTNSVREHFLESAREDAIEKWNETINGKRLSDLREELEMVLCEAQLEKIPATDRIVLEKHDMVHTTEVFVRVCKDATDGKIKYAYHCTCGGDSAELSVPVYKRSGPGCFPFERERAIADMLGERCPEVLNEWFLLYCARSCEVEHVVKAWRTILFSCNTIKQLVEKMPDAARFLPSTIRPNDVGATEGKNSVEEALRTVRAFGE